MSAFRINGVERNLPIEAEKPFNDLLLYVRQHIATETSLISRVLVNGIELSESDENVFRGIPLSQLQSVEVFTTHPREMAEETLQMLIEFAGHLESLSLETSISGDLRKLVEGITTFTDGIQGVKSLLRIGFQPHIAILEADLVEILKEALEYKESGQDAYVAELLREHLPANLREWREKGLPALIRSRDS